jgi:hypothetical protein
MKHLEDIVSLLKQHQEILNHEFRVTEVYVFGSYARGQQTEGSDVDILIDYQKAPTLWMLADLRRYLGQLLNLQVDVVTKNGLKPRIREQVLAEAVKV